MITKTNSRLPDTAFLLILALCGTLIHILLNGQYGFHRDELDFIMNARQLDWGYVSYPPVTPFFARIGLELFGESLRGLCVLPAIAQSIVMILAGLMARDMGGKRGAQLMTALAVFIAPVSLMGGTVIMYFAFDYLWWVLVAFFTVRLLVTDDARYWLGIGAGIGCDGQILVTHDMLGLYEEFHPRFVRRYGQLANAMREAFHHYRDNVKDTSFPNDQESY